MSSRFPGRGGRGGGRGGRGGQGGERGRGRGGQGGGHGRKRKAAQDEERSPSPAHKEPTKKRRKEDTTQQKRKELAAFFTLLDDDYIRFFLARDGCKRISDKYLLAMVFAYFRRAGLSTEEYREYFFAALFLANQFEEEEEDFRAEIYPWALGHRWTKKTSRLHDDRNLLLLRMDFKAWVDRSTCDRILAEDPSHWAWTRERKDHHGWAIRYFRRDDRELTTYGPKNSPPSCTLCKTISAHPRKGNVCQADTEEEPGTSYS
ncbi:speedy protein 1-A-like [Dendropsophus ebraccatus]|uniref:speedy protein 1-A-like n=1 Tax=Dendropsophus ebraccatus TaxID=150705 RepID=UPI00383231B9